MPSRQCDFRYRERRRGVGRGRLPGRRFRHVAADVENEQSRQHADHEHAAPADILEQGAVDDRGEKISSRIARLQQAGDEAAGLRRNRFHRQRGADAPLAAHGDAVDRAQHQERGQARREAGGELDHRIEQHVDHQGRAPAEAVRGPAEDEGAQRPHRQRQQNGPGDGADIGVEFLRDVLEHEHHQEEIERIERPAEKARRDDMLLLAGPAGKRRDCH